MRRSIAVVIGILAALAVTVASAQDVRIKTPAPGPEPRAVAPGWPHATSPGDESRYGGAPRVPFEPAFIRPLVREVRTPASTGRIGLAGWTSPNTPIEPVATGWREVNGWLAFGLAWTWGGPPPGSSLQR